VPLLAEYFIQREVASSGGLKGEISPEVLGLLESYSWPGNVRELQNVLQFAWIKCRGGEMAPEHLPPSLTKTVELGKKKLSRQGKLSIDAVAEALEATGGNKTEAAKHLGCSRATLYRFLDENSALVIDS